MGKHRYRDDQRPHRRDQFAVPPRPAPRLSWNAVIIAAGLVLLSTVVWVVASRESGSAAAQPRAQALTGDVRLDVAQFDDGQARFYRYAAADGRELRFFVLKSSDGVVRAALDTCDVCYRERKGYRQVGDTMVCNNCGKAFRSVDINVLQGGCNPVPLDRVVQNGQVVLTATALQAGAFYF